MDQLIFFFDRYTPEILLISGGLLVFTVTLFLWVWVLNRKNFNLLKHQLPAGVVKSYLDLIIQNSQALKSSLLRGSHPDGTAPDFAQILSPANLPGNGQSVVLTGTSGSPEELNKKLAEISMLHSELGQSRKTQTALESELQKIKEELISTQEKNKTLESSPKALASGGDGAIKSDLVRVTKERDELLEKLKEYEIIEDDLANLKRLQQENAQLKKALEGSGGSIPVASAPAIKSPLAAATSVSSEPLPEITPDIVAVAEDLDGMLDQETKAENKVDQAELDRIMEEMASAADVEIDSPVPVAEDVKSKQEEKTPEDLLSEFEKMLG